jgi:beta-N-acetylhexosaminidase
MGGMSLRSVLRPVLPAVLVLGLLAAPAPAVAELGPDRLPSCADVLAAMSPRAKLAQRLMVGVDGSDPRGTAETVRETQVGGLFIGGNPTDLLRNQALRGVQAMTRIPLAVAVDDEGGRVQRIDALDGQLPSARAMSALDPEKVRELGKDRGKALAARGVTMDLAPTVDVSRQPANAVIGDRSFGDDPKAVAQLAGAFADGLHDAGIFAVLKHFPGHGHANGDSHKGRVTTPPLDQLREADLDPYTELLGQLGAQKSTGVMVGHLDVPGLTAGLPASLTPAAYALLRDEFHFDGFVLTDDLGAMKAVTSEFALPEAVEHALAAGADMALWSSGGKVAPVLDRLEQAHLENTDAAVTRILKAKSTCS